MASEFGEQYGGMQAQMRRGDGHHDNPMAMEQQSITQEGMQHGGPHTAVEGMQHGGPHTAIDEGMHQHQQQQPQLRRSGSSSSSSSEDDGEGGRRKKGTKGKMMKEKLGGGGGGQEGVLHQYPTSAEEAGAAGEKKGMMERIKDKIPGMH